VTDHPISFTAEMVRALFRGKTQTRRVVNWKRIAWQSGCTKGTLGWSPLIESWAVFNGNGDADLCAVTCPYGRVGDRLWVREMWGLTRLWLHIVNVRVERVRDISEEDAEAEGVESREAYFDLWDTINAKRGYPVIANPYVWVLTFKRSEKP